mmetsp:Transcript_37955/g.87759  ORF Transcript_37955/g.87759 Transcript_37955/m.87759 type:complete len:201 (-) Transcript_37955:2663-3265(-)
MPQAQELLLKKAVLLSEVVAIDVAQSLNHVPARCEVDLTTARPLLHQVLLFLRHMVESQVRQELLDLLLVESPTIVHVALLKGFLQLLKLLFLVPAHDLQELVKVDLSTLVNIDIVHEVLLLLDGAGITTPSQCSAKFHHVHTLGIICVVSNVCLAELFNFLWGEAFPSPDKPQHQIEVVKGDIAELIHTTLSSGLLHKF